MNSTISDWGWPSASQNEIYLCPNLTEWIQNHPNEFQCWLICTAYLCKWKMHIQHSMEWSKVIVHICIFSALPEKCNLIIVANAFDHITLHSFQPHYVAFLITQIRIDMCESIHWSNRQWIMGIMFAFHWKRNRLWKSNNVTDKKLLLWFMST